MPQWIEMTRSPEYSPKLIGQELVFLQNDFRGLLSDLGDVAFVDKIEKAMLGETIIIGGYIRTELIAANSIVGDKIASNAIVTRHIQAGTITADKLDVQTLSAISANLGTITAGSITGVTITGGTIRTSSGNNRIELSSNLLRSYSGGVRRVQLDYDSLDFYTSDNRLGGEIVASVDSIFNLPTLSLQSNNGIAELHSQRSSTNYAHVYASAFQDVDDDDAVVGAHVRYGSGYGDIEVYPGAVFIGARYGSNITDLEVSSDGVTVYGAFSVTGQKSAVVETEDYGWRKLYALETPDNRFVAYMEKELDIGEHYIEIEPMFRQTISDFFVVPHVQNNADVSILERKRDGFMVLVEKKRAEVVFEVNGVRKGYEGVYMEEVKHDLKGRISKHEN